MILKLYSLCDIAKILINMLISLKTGSVVEHCAFSLIPYPVISTTVCEQFSGCVLVLPTLIYEALNRASTSEVKVTQSKIFV